MLWKALKLKARKLIAERGKFTAEYAESAEKRLKLKKISHPRGIGFAFHRAGRHIRTHTDLLSEQTRPLSPRARDGGQACSDKNNHRFAKKNIS
jgi:hypothetical protein